MVHKLRWILTIFAAAMCVASVVVWIWSYSHPLGIADRTVSSAGWSPAWLEKIAGVSSLRCGAHMGRGGVVWRTYSTQASAPNWVASTGSNFAGISIKRWNSGEAKLRDGTYIVSWEHSLWFPVWYITAFFGAIAMFGAWTIIRNRPNRGPTLCKSCGYDLRAGHNKCPECGGESHVKVGASNATNTPSAPSVQR